MKYDIIVPALIAFGVSVILSPIIIPFLKNYDKQLLAEEAAYEE